jgi:hypothetical protein
MSIVAIYHIVELGIMFDISFEIASDIRDNDFP